MPLQRHRPVTTPARLLVLGDGPVGAGLPVKPGSSLARQDPGPVCLLPIGLAAPVWVLVQYAVEHDRVPRRIEASGDRPIAPPLASGVLVVLGVLVAVVL
jgi:hypothetical protein